MSREREYSQYGGAAIALLGLAAVVRGAYLAWPPAGWIVGGLLLAAPAVFISYSAAREK